MLLPLTPAPTAPPLPGVLVYIFQAGHGMRSIPKSYLPEKYR